LQIIFQMIFAPPSLTWWGFLALRDTISLQAAVNHGEPIDLSIFRGSVSQ
jgi:hypothetical protein